MLGVSDVDIEVRPIESLFYSQVHKLIKYL